MNSDNMPTAQEIIDRLDEPDLMIDSRVDRNDAVQREIERFCADNSNAWQQLVSGNIPELRDDCFTKFDDESRQVFAAKEMRDHHGFELPGFEPVVTRRVGVTHDDRRQIGDTVLPPHVPIALWRNGFEFHRQYCWGFGDSSLAAAYDTVRNLPTPPEEYDLDNSGGCDFGFVPATIHRTISRMSDDPDLAGFKIPLSVWPIPRWDHVLLMKICSACIGALFEKYQIGKSLIEVPWRTDSGR